MKFVLAIIALVLATFTNPTVAQDYTGYVGIFFNLSTKATLRDTFLSTETLGTGDNSSTIGSYDHITIHFQPNFTQLANDYNPKFGAQQTAHILGYAMDEHGQAILVSIDSPNAIQSQNAFPHVTISSASRNGPYAAVYSNDLWARIAASGYVIITNNEFGKPQSITWNLTNPAVIESNIIDGEYQFTLPEYTGLAKYNSTLVNVTLLTTPLGGMLNGTFCASSQWNGTTGICNTAPIVPTPPPTTPTPTTPTPTTPAPTATPTPTTPPPPPVYRGGYVGVFYNLTVKAALKNTFYSTNILSTADNSSKVGSYDHITIHFEPNQMQLDQLYNPRLGAKQTAQILGYAMDEHGQAILVKVTGANAIQSLNAFPHVTISSSNSPGYSAVYSNDLWARVAASGYVNITNDAFGKPSSLAWNDSLITDSSQIINNTYQFTLPEYTGIVKYNATLVRVTLIESTVPILEGTFCANRNWNGAVCNTAPVIINPTTTAPPTGTPTPTATPTTPSNSTSSSSSSSSSSTGAAPSSSSSGAPSSSSILTSSFTIVSSGIVSAFIALFFL